MKRLALLCICLLVFAGCGKNHLKEARIKLDAIKAEYLAKASEEIDYFDPEPFVNPSNPNMPGNEGGVNQAAVNLLQFITGKHTYTFTDEFFGDKPYRFTLVDTYKLTYHSPIREEEYTAQFERDGYFDSAQLPAQRRMQAEVTAYLYEYDINREEWVEVDKKVEFTIYGEE